MTAQTYHVTFSAHTFSLGMLKVRADLLDCVWRHKRWSEFDMVNVLI